MILGYQTCLFVQHASVLRIESIRDHPDTVYIVEEHITNSAVLKKEKSEVVVKSDTIRRNASHSPIVESVRRERRKVESFEFNPNTISHDGLVRLGFSEKQARSIINYREKGGVFSRAEDFGKSYVVSDSVFRRLEPFIRIPKVDINLADSAAFDALPGIGPYYAAQMVKYRTQLGGYARVEQLMDLYKIDDMKLSSICDLIECNNPHYLDLWNASEDSLALHPAIRRRSTARSIILYKKNSAPEDLTIEALSKAGVIDSVQRVRLIRCTLPVDSL